MVKKFLKRLFAQRSEQERMYDYLCQATDTVHLEWLQKEWDRMSHEQRRSW